MTKPKKSSLPKQHAAPVTGLRQVSLAPGKAIRRKVKGRDFPGGIVADAPNGPPGVQPHEVLTADLLFPPIVPLPINVSNGGGAIGTGLPVQLIFWGGAWNQPATSPSAGAILASVQTILRGPWMSGLRQYGIRRCNLRGATVVTGPTAPGTYNDNDIKDLIWALIDDNKFPEPDDSGGRIIYMVFMPPGTTYGPGGIRGKHLVASDFDFPADNDHAWVGFVVFNAAIGQITSTFCHELAETCTDPSWTHGRLPEIRRLVTSATSSTRPSTGSFTNLIGPRLTTPASFPPPTRSVALRMVWTCSRRKGAYLRSKTDPEPQRSRRVSVVPRL